MRMGKKERAALRYKQAVRDAAKARYMRSPHDERVGKFVTVWGNPMPRGKPARDWTFQPRKRRFGPIIVKQID